MIGAKSAANITINKLKQLKNFSFKTSLVADYVNYNENDLVTPIEMISAIEKGLSNFTSNVGNVSKGKTHSVPIDLIITPLTYFN